MSKKPSVDGFIPRRSPGMIGERHAADKKLPKPDVSGLVRHPSMSPVDSQEERSTNAIVPTAYGLQRPGVIIRREDVDQSLRDIDIQSEAEKKRHGRRRISVKKLFKRLIIVLLIAAIGFGGWVGVKTLLASNAVFKGDIFGLVQQRQLKMDDNGRTNILVFGTSEDDPGHPGGNLTDSIMVLTVDQKKNNAYMVSIPRDLEVRYGRSCVPGYSGKINAFFQCVNDDFGSSSAEDERQTEFRKLVSEVVGLDIQYSVHVNYSVMRDVVKALDGITVMIEGSGGAPGVMDSNFDWKCGATYSQKKKNCPPNGHFIEYKNGLTQLDAEHALYLAMARGDIEPTYGLGNSNFDREKNQQKIIVAIKEKAMSTGTITNVGKVSGIIDALGKNLRTNFETAEIRTIMKLAETIPTDQIKSISLLDNQLVTGAAQPVAGMYNFTQIQAYIKKQLNASPLALESAHVIVLNASGVAGAAQKEADRLMALGMEIDQVGNAPASATYKTNTIYQATSATDKKKPLTLEKLVVLYGKNLSAEALPIQIPATTDYVIVIVSPPTSSDNQ